MKTCTVCQKEITPQMIRHGSAISRGSSLYHRNCHRSHREGTVRSVPPPTGHASPPRRQAPTSFPDIPEAVDYASFWRRFGAHVIDSFILNVVVFVASFLFGLGAGAFGLVEPTLLSVLGGIIGFVLPITYCVVFWVRTGATPGKVALGVRVVSAGGGPLRPGQSVLRYFGYVVSAFVFCLGYLAMLWDDENRCWHDRMAGTRVIRV